MRPFDNDNTWNLTIGGTGARGTEFALDGESNTDIRGVDFGTTASQANWPRSFQFALRLRVDPVAPPKNMRSQWL